MSLVAWSPDPPVIVISGNHDDPAIIGWVFDKWVFGKWPFKWILPTSPGCRLTARTYPERQPTAACRDESGQEVPPWRKLSITWKLKQTLWMRKQHSYDKESMTKNLLLNARRLNKWKKASSSRQIDARGLMPCVTTDATTGDVLMMGYMNDEALLQTIATGEAHYWSRSRQCIWHKGATSSLLRE